jgi:DNA-binding NarL/FixJ family response regulator
MGCRHTVLLLSSDAIGWDELRRILAALPDVRVVGDTADPAEARRLAATHTPDAIIAAATLGGRPVLPLLADLRRTCCPATKAILVAADYAPGRLRSPEDTGVVGYLLWADLSPAVLRHCLAAAIAGDVILGSGTVVRRFVAGLRGERSSRLAAMGISERERAILGRLADGQTREAIGAAEGLSPTTVKRAIADLEAKLGAPNQFVLAVKATQAGLIR